MPDIKDATPAPGPSVVDPATTVVTPAAPAVVTPPVTPPVVTDVAPAPVVTPPVVTDAAPTAKDWASRRVEYAKGDEKLEKRLARYSSEESVIDALIAAQNKIASGALKSTLPEKPTPAELADWRTENGIPATPEEYDTTLPDGMVVGEFDKPVVDAFTKKAHELNLPPSAVKETLAWYFKNQEQQALELRQADIATGAATTAELREEWGSEYPLNINLVDGLLSAAPAGLKEQLDGARLADGTPLMADAKSMRWLADLARTINPTATIVPGAGMTSLQTVEGELESITKLMADQTSDYWKGPKAEGMQARYRSLIEAKSKMQK